MALSPPWRNGDVDWNRWPVPVYLAENYRELHPCDQAVIEHHSAFYRRLPPDSVDRSMELGAGPNLYPLLLASATCQRIDAIEPSAASVAYLRRQCRRGPDPSWEPFHAYCRRLQPNLPATVRQALGRVRVVRAGARDVRPGHYGLASMNFVAESVTEEAREFDQLCATYAGGVRPGGHLVAAFMENMARYQLGDGSWWPGYRVDLGRVGEAFNGLVEDLRLTRIDADPTLPDYGYTGMVLLTARRRS